MKKKLIIITGASGSGKSAVSNVLYKSLKNCFWVEGNKCGIIEPVIKNTEIKNMMLKNISHIINSYINNTGCEYIVFNWTIHSNEIIDKILNSIDRKLEIEPYVIILTCSKGEIDRRIESDIKEHKRNDTQYENDDTISLYKKLDGIRIDTTDKSISSIKEDIINIISVKSNIYKY